MKDEIKFQFQEFKEYANFLLADQSLQKEVSESYLGQIRNTYPPLMQLLAQLPVQEALALAQNDFQAFLVLSLKDNPLGLAGERIKLWKNRNLSGGTKGNTASYDMLRVYGIQKQLLINFLGRFTQDLFTFSCIVHELEDFLGFLEAFCANGEEGPESLAQSPGEEREAIPVLDSLPVLLAFVRKDKTVGFVNTAYAGFFNLNKEEVVGIPVGEIQQGLASKDLEVPLAQALNGETVKTESQINISGLIKWLGTTFFPKKANGTVEGVYLIIEDVTEIKARQTEAERKVKLSGEAIQELEKKNLQLQMVNNDLNSFVYIASHDLRAPVSNLESLLQLLREKFMGRADAEEARVLQLTELTTGRLRKTIGDLMDVIKVQKGANGIIVGEKEVIFQQLTQEVKEDIHDLILKNKALIVEDFQVERIYYQRAGMRSIIYNLLSNAIKYYSPDRPLLVEVATYLQGDEVVLSVRDNGMGLSFDQLKNLFSMFNRVHQHVEGTGIGLYSIKKMVERSGGRIDIKSEEGKGSEFLVYLPNKR